MMFLALLCVKTCVPVIYVAVILCYQILLFRFNELFKWKREVPVTALFPPDPQYFLYGNQNWL